jgi:hypothetical protein
VVRSWLNEVQWQFGRFAPRYRIRGYREETSHLPAQDLVPETILEGLGETSRRMALLYAWILRDLVWTGNGEHRRAADVGAKDFVYATVLHHFLTVRNHPHTRLDGIEADPYRLYWNLYRRGDRGRYFADRVNQRVNDSSRVAYHGGNWLDWEPGAQFDLITCFFPFLYRQMSREWGLPDRFHAPEKLYRKAISQSAEVLFLHLGDDERRLSAGLIEQIGIGRIVELGRFQDNPWWPILPPIHAILWRRSSTGYPCS